MSHHILSCHRAGEGGKPWQQEGLLQLVGRIGRERRDPSSAAQMLELLWRLAHAPSLGSRLVSTAMELHTEVLAETSGDEQVRSRAAVSSLRSRRSRAAPKGPRLA